MHFVLFNVKQSVLQVSLTEEPKATEELTGAGAMVGGGNSKWEALSLVPDRSVDGLVTRKWDKRLARKPKMVLKKSESIFVLESVLSVFD